MSRIQEFYALSIAAGTNNTEPWTNLSYAADNDTGTYADTAIGINPGTGVAELEWTNFGFAIPHYAIIDGLLIEWYLAMGGIGVDYTTIDLLGPATLGSLNAGEAAWNNGSVGGATDPLIGYVSSALTPADINDSGFGVRVNGQHAGSSTGDISLNAYEIIITAYYHIPISRVVVAV